MGRGGGRGRRWRHRHWLNATGLTGWQRASMECTGPRAVMWSSVSREQELAALKHQAESLAQSLGELKTRIQELEAPVPDAPGKEAT
jgi:hypothetical protein